VALKEAEYGQPVYPKGSTVGVMEGGDTSICRLAVAVVAGDDVSATITVNVDKPGAVGVPEMDPVDPSRLNPGGSAPDVIDQL
jgi:hypothetical protein